MDNQVGGSVVNGKFAPIGEPRCPGCSGTGPAVSNGCPSVRTCSDCGGLFTAGAIPADVAERFVHIYAPMQANAAAQRYFDFSIIRAGLPAMRLHGWFDPISKRVVQCG